MSIKDLTPRCPWLLTISLLDKRLGFEAVKLSKPFARVGNDRFQQDSFADLSDSYFISGEMEFTRKANRLAPAVAKAWQF
jgi:hypothetical protein